MEPLLDPCNDRPVKSVEAPPYLPLSDELCWSGPDLPNWENIRDHLKREGKLKKEHVIRMTEMCLEIVKKEPNLVYIAEPV